MGFDLFLPCFKPFLCAVKFRLRRREERRDHRDARNYFQTLMDSRRRQGRDEVQLVLAKPRRASCAPYRSSIEGRRGGIVRTIPSHWPVDNVVSPCDSRVKKLSAPLHFP